ncbi:YhcN/YlaJ family sporulation lipoprotein [Paenibacillus radicis (ex Xue et al. 2023)]|uniref:YhcN/YlaJ family sporulation lipoprotein n=1 Tax=Paenibacillus radicis (ex Xue et al. 2023) TaxID=2972489 RepID=A0ABT1YIC6_9BACL|nr:YhcN/YlaJ family sporulation lipoprotein [Paenibacillus radicis (ex Xue et al. 2023)]MCR8632495.1 YhcN/YlaJ family sporulation lipoprotein [Paenibacillus radicis (ex Xue et al. 2023)]
MKKNQFAKQMVIATMIASTLLFVGCSKANNKVQQQSTNMNNGTVHQQAATDNRIQIADQAVANILKLNEVRQANVLVTNRNAYVAAVLKSGVELSRAEEDQIAAQVRAADSNIQNVYVSTNPDFVGRINTYVQDVRQGKPVSGFFNEFSEMVKRLFPSAH